jgi:pseudouridine-5'-phosphate glycosidase
MIQTSRGDRTILKYSDEVREALRNGRPVVALESTIISHGMPFPQNLETALNVEKAVRDNGAVPATIAVLDGNVCVGINSSELVRPQEVARTWP